MDNTNILIIPNNLQSDFFNRSYQMAFELSKNNVVYCLIINNKSKHNLEDLDNNITNLLNNNILKINFKENIKEIVVPYLECECCDKVKAYSNLVEKIINFYNIKFCINSSFENFSIKEELLEKIFYIYDITEDYLENTENKIKIKVFIERELYKAHLNITSSKTLEKIYKKMYWCKIIYLPNGAFKKINDENKIRNIKYKLRNKFDISNPQTKIFTVLNLVNYRVNLDLIYKSFFDLRNSFSLPMKLLISKNVATKIINDKDVIYSEVENEQNFNELLCFSDVGLLPLSDCNYNNNSLPMSVIQYGLYKKIVVSTPCKELQLHNFPHIIFTNEKIKSWVTALLWSLQENWDDDWNCNIEKYNWKKLVLLLRRIVKRYR